jgi:AcrR family transcriptional regulator
VPPHDSFRDRPADTREAVLVATHDLLCEWGYSDLSMAKIAEHAGVSKSVLYYHYDDKDDLLRALLDATLATFHDPTADSASASRLSLLVDTALAEPLPGDREGVASPITASFLQTYVELCVQAASDPDYRELFTARERSLRHEFAASATGEPDGPDDIERLAECLLTLVQGAAVQRVTTDGVDLDAVRRVVDRHHSVDVEHEQ